MHGHSILRSNTGYYCVRKRVCRVLMRDRHPSQAGEGGGSIQHLRRMKGGDSRREYGEQLILCHSTRSLYLYNREAESLACGIVKVSQSFI
jgi:hypothetical protein